jgi:hypothetical protein
MARQFSADNWLRACAAHHARRCRSDFSPKMLAGSKNGSAELPGFGVAPGLAIATKRPQVSTACGHSRGLARTLNVARSSLALSSQRSL